MFYDLAWLVFGQEPLYVHDTYIGVCVCVHLRACTHAQCSHKLCKITINEDLFAGETRFCE